MTISSRPLRPPRLRTRSATRSLFTAGAVAVMLVSGATEVLAQPSTTPAPTPSTVPDSVPAELAPAQVDPCATPTTTAPTTTIAPPTSTTTTITPPPCDVSAPDAVVPSEIPLSTQAPTSQPRTSDSQAPASSAPVTPTPEAPSAAGEKIPYTGLPTENPNSTIIPGKMRSDREELPEGFTKEQADKAEVREAELQQIQRQQSLARAIPQPGADCSQYWPSENWVCGAIRDKYVSLGAQWSFLTFPTSEELVNPDGYGRRQLFANGPIYWSANTGAHPVVNSFLNRWGIHSYEAGWIGYPTSDEIVLPDGGRRQEFVGAAIYVAFQNAVGSAIANGPLRDKYNTVGGLTPAGTLLGYPIQDQIPVPGGGQMIRFERGVIYWSQATGAHWVNGRILNIWAGAGYESGEYGYPTSDTAPRNGEQNSAEQTFANGFMYLSANQYFEGLIAPVAGGVGFEADDTAIRPDFTLQPDLSQYGSALATDAAVLENTQAAGATGAYFADQGVSNTAELFDHYYGNSGADYGVSASYLNVCLRSDTQNYPAPTVPSLGVANENRGKAVARAVAEAAQLGRQVKLITTGPWTSNVASDNQDCTLGLGRFSTASTTAVIATPGAGETFWDARQASHVQDIYDFANGDTEYPGLAQTAVNNAYDGYLLGIAKPFLVYGKTNDQSFQGAL